jgi:hypothetical protein
MSERRTQLTSLISKLPKIYDSIKSKSEAARDQKSDDMPPEQIHAKAERWANSQGLQPPTK